VTASTCQTARRSLVPWLVRGAVGLALLGVAAWTHDPIVTVPALLAALIALRGCPMCWIVELVERGSQEHASSATKETP
jgi:hypothetical protein